MKNIVKTKTDGTLMQMPSIYKASWDIRNDTDTKLFCARHDLWEAQEDTQCPTYDPETQYATSHYEKTEDIDTETQLIITRQVWEIHDKPPVEPTPDIEQIEAQGLYTATMTDTLLEDTEDE